MSLMTSMSNTYFDFIRRTAFVLETAAAVASVAATRSLRTAGYLEATVSGGTTGSGTVSFTGTDPDGNVLLETLTFTGNGVIQTTKRFASLTADIATTGLADEAVVPTLGVRAVSADGQPELMHTTIVSGRPAVYSTFGRPGWDAPRQGTQETGRVHIDIDYEEIWAPQVGDLVTEGGNTWLVKVVDPKRTGFGYGTRWWRVTMDRYET